MSKIHPETRTYPLQRRFGCKGTTKNIDLQVKFYNYWQNFGQDNAIPRHGVSYTEKG